MVKEAKKTGFGAIVVWTLIFLAIIILSKTVLYFVVPLNVYTPYHAVIEFLTIITGIIIFYYSNKSYKQSGSNVVRIIGWAFLAMALIDIFHIMAFKGFPNPFFTPGSNAGIWFWLPARFVGAVLLFISAIVSVSKKRKNFSFLKWLTIIYVVVMIPLAIYNTYNQVLPAMFIDGVGLTALKIFLEYFVMALFGITAIIYGFVFYKNRSKTLDYFIIGLIATFFSELAFTMYLSVSDVFNFVGHILKLVAYVFFYYGIVSSLRTKR
ncbi:MAG: MASE3 domain-containing protein [archaeon]